MYKSKLFFFLFLYLITQIGFTQITGLLFDGDEDFLSTCHDANFNIGDQFTVEAWINAKEWRPEIWRGSILAKDGIGPDSGFAFRCGENGRLSFVMATAGWQEVQSAPLMNLNQWHHVAAVVDNGSLTLLLDGTVVASGSYNGSTTSNTTIMNIGSSPSFPGRFFDGFIDEVRVWNIARSSNEINENQTTAFNGDETGLIAYFPMNEGLGLITENLVDIDCSAEFQNMTEDSWSEGFTSPEFDVGVVSINAPDILSIFERPVKVNISVQNFGTESISNIPITLTVNGLPTLEETFSSTIPSGETRTFTLTQPLDLSGNNTNLLDVSTRHPDDTSNSNDDISYRYKKPVDGVINIINEEQHNFGSAGQTQFTLVNFPENMEDFSEILLHFSIDCPSSGCDPWDQPGSFFLEAEDGNSYELARFITPFGIDCGPWTIDITDFKSVMRGPALIRSFIQVWGPSGWLVNADIQFIKAEEPSYRRITQIWQENNWVYGDPGIDDDLPTQSVVIADVTESGHLRTTISGHGQGNTDNAAEFSNKTHTLMVNSTQADSHNLWKADCVSNTCANQNGTWLFARAGWCPGQSVRPYVFNLSDNMTPGQPMTIDYELEDYVNFQNTGYDGAGHTEPHYRIFSYLIESSNQWFMEYNNLSAESIEVETNGDMSNPIFESVTLYIKNTGDSAVSNPNVSYYINDEFVFEESITATIAPGATYTHEFSQVDGFTGGQDHLVIGVVSSDGDENLNDDAIDTFVNDDLTSITEVDRAAFKVYPNPTDGIINVEFSEAFENGNVSVMDIQGRLVQSYQIGNKASMSFTIEVTGVFILKVATQEGNTLIKKLILH